MPALIHDSGAMLRAKKLLEKLLADITKAKQKRSAAKGFH